ncbi:MAG: Hsp20/alpha crystallin family protein [Chitinophagaceae bacterium]|nr:MAG: Hsp20/alpha crystallin family protein [Chitinophagaceae bacterium]
MTLLKWKSQEPTISNPLSRYFEDFFDRDLLADNFRNTLPSVNVAENEDEFRLEIAAPGFTKDNFNMELEENVLTLSGELKKSESEKDENYTRREFQFSSFKRSFTLPDIVDADKISATYSDGILKVILPKKEEQKKLSKKSININ